MLRVSKLADYSTVAMSYMALTPEGVHTATGVAAAIRVTVPTVSKILKILAREGLLVSLRGARGGYRLAHRPGQISVARVIEAVEGPFAFTECSGAPCHCIQEPNCPIRSNWQRIHRDVRKVLEEVSLADMVRPTGYQASGPGASKTRPMANGAQATRPGGVSSSTNRGRHE